MSSLRRVETHVRVMAERDQVSATDRSIDMLNPSLPFGGSFNGFTRVHRDDARSNDGFFQSSLAKIAAGAAAGQSHTVLICGPPKSGRSQTMYDVSGPGVVHLMAQALLDIPDATVHYTAHYCQDADVFDSFAGKSEVRPLNVADLAAPVGAMPLSRVKLLENARDAVVVPRGKRPESTCFVTFHVYKRIDVADSNERRDSFAIITFVDLCSFDDHLTRDLKCLMDVVARTNASEAADYNSCMLTRLLEPSIGGGRCLTVVTAITGAKSTSAAACTALDFTLRAGKIGQVAPLCQIIPPSWLRHVCADVEQLDASRQHRIDQAFRRGCSAAYERMVVFLRSRREQHRAALEECEDETAIRARMQQVIAGRLKELNADDTGFAETREALTQDAKRARAEADDVERAVAATERRIHEVEGATEDLRRQRAQMDAQAQLELAKLDGDRVRSDRMVADLDAKNAAYQDAIADATGRTEMLAERVRRAVLTINRDNALAKLDAKRARIEAALGEAGERAREQTSARWALQERQASGVNIARTTASLRPESASPPKLTRAKKSTSRATGFSSRGRPAQSDLRDPLL